MDNKNIAKLLKKRLPPDVLRLIRRIGALAQDNGLPAYIVGGFVRDVLLGIKNLDLDVVVEGKAIDFAMILKDKMATDLVIYRRFGTATITLPFGFKVDIAGARREHYAYAAALPGVYPSSIREDLFRRDFTINALAIKVNPDNFGQLLDLFEGRKDIREKRIGVLHDRSFIDDPTRILRAVRFEQRYNFTIDKHTEKLIREAQRLKMLNKLSRFRAGNEIILILKEERPLKCLKRLSKLCGLKFIHPLIKLNQRENKQFKPAKDAIDLFRKTNPGEPLDSWLIYFMILTYRVNLAMAKKLYRDFSLTKANVRKLEFFKKAAAAAVDALSKEKRISAHRIYRILHPFSCEAILVLLTLAKTPGSKRRVRLFLSKLWRVKLKLTGRDLLKLKVKPGPRYKEILRKVLFAKIDGRLRTKTEELNCAREILRK